MEKVIINEPDVLRPYVGMILREKVTNFFCGITSIDNTFKEVYIIYCDGSMAVISFDDLQQDYVVAKIDVNNDKTNYIVEYQNYLQEIEEEWMQQNTKG